MSSSTRNVILWILTVTFFFRVFTHFVIWLKPISFLPPVDRWHSHIMPYGLLLAAQIAIIILLVTISVHFSRRRGYFYEAGTKNGWIVFYLGLLYLAGMIVRFFIQGISIMVVFHFVLSSFVILVGWHYFKKSR